MDLTKDKMITAYRNHVQPIGMGVDPKRVMAELLEKLPELQKVWVVLCIFFLKSIVFMAVTEL
jgi:hypothetical protein